MQICMKPPWRAPLHASECQPWPPLRTWRCMIHLDTWYFNHAACQLITSPKMAFPVWYVIVIRFLLYFFVAENRNQLNGDTMREWHIVWVIGLGETALIFILSVWITLRFCKTALAILSPIEFQHSETLLQWITLMAWFRRRIQNIAGNWGWIQF